MQKQTSMKSALAVLFGFWVMGFADVIGISVTYAKEQFSWSESEAGFLPFMVFFWFLVLSVPTAALMNRIGRKNTVLVSMAFTFAGMSLPFFLFNEGILYLAFALLGIGNTLLQVSLNPLLTNVISGKLLTSALTAGQLIKAISAFVGPMLAVFCSLRWGSWESMFLIYAGITLLSAIWLSVTSIEKESTTGQASLSIKSTFSLLGNSKIVWLFFAIICVVGLDVGMNTITPKLLMSRLDMAKEVAGYGTSWYFAARTVGAFVGVFLLSRVSEKVYFSVNMIIALLAVIGLAFSFSYAGILVIVCVIAFCAAGIFSVIYSLALRVLPEKANGISGLMITGVSGGAVIPLLMGIAADYWGTLNGALFILALCVVYLLICSFRITILKVK
ncbi:MFS transporter [Bacteroides sp.]